MGVLVSMRIPENLDHPFKKYQSGGHLLNGDARLLLGFTRRASDRTKYPVPMNSCLVKEEQAAAR